MEAIKDGDCVLIPVNGDVQRHFHNKVGKVLSVRSGVALVVLFQTAPGCNDLGGLCNPGYGVTMQVRYLTKLYPVRDLLRSSRGVMPEDKGVGSWKFGA
jgi:hypothetical protein